MRYPAAETAEKHDRILDHASRLFRKRGFDGVSLGEIMRATGLTHGPFYNHFASKEALITESIEDASGKALADMDAAAASPGGMFDFVQRYLTTDHRDTPEQGCLMAALGAEISRENSGQGVREAFTGHLNAIIDRLQRQFPWRSKKTSRAESIRLLSSMVGALVLSRAVNDEELSQEILCRARETIA